jgi:hypothetical protein
MTKRFAKYPESNTHGYYFVFGDKEWDEIESEKVYGVRLSKTVRELVSLATLNLTLWWPREQSAPRLDGATTKRLLQLVMLAEQMRSELFPPHYWLPEYQVDFHPRSAKTGLELNLERIGDSDHFGLFFSCLNSIIEISDIILRNSDSQDYCLKDGRTWNVWVVLITSIMKANNLPIGIRSDSYRIKADLGATEPSPFVRLIKHLQDLVLQRNKKFSSPGALSKEIQRARASVDVPENVGKDSIEKFIYGILGVPDYAGLPQDPSPMELMVYWILEGRNVGAHSVLPERPFYYTDDVRQAAPSEDPTISQNPRRSRRK